MKLTKGQERVLIFIARHIRQQGYPPSLREICRAIGATSANAASDYVKKLVAAGVIERKERLVSRGITLTEAGHSYLEDIDYGYLLARQLG